jgi:hypothetical protein
MLIGSVVLMGCQTITLSEGPDVSRLPMIPDAPLVGLVVSDTRQRDKIGNVGATSIIVSTKDTARMLENYLIMSLHDSGASAISMPPSVDLGSATAIREAAKRYNAQGFLKAEIESLSVGSLDLILNPPRYDTTLGVALFSAEGELLFHDRSSVWIKNQSFTAAGEAKAIERLVVKALRDVERTGQFRRAVIGLGSQ